jgi:hypothetical protein
VGGGFCLDEALLGHLSPKGSRETEEVSKAKGTRTGRADLQEFPFCQVGLRGDFSTGITHAICSLVRNRYLNFRYLSRGQKSKHNGSGNFLVRHLQLGRPSWLHIP